MQKSSDSVSVLYSAFNKYAKNNALSLQQFILFLSHLGKYVALSLKMPLQFKTPL